MPNLNMKQIELSIIITVYNISAYLDSCLQSILTQKNVSIEVICINDGSHDSSEVILNKYASSDRRVIVVSQKNKGVSAARNLGIELSRGKYIWFVDGDDKLMEESCYKLLEYAYSYKTDFIFFGAKFSGQKDADFDGLNSLVQPRDIFYDSFSPDIIFKEKGSKPFVWNCLYKSELIKSITVKFDTNIKLGEDQAFQVSYIPLGKRFLFVKDKFYLYRYKRKNGAMALISQNKETKYYEHIKVIESVALAWKKQRILKIFATEFIDWAIDFLGKDLAVSEKNCEHICKKFISVFFSNKLLKKKYITIKNAKVFFMIYSQFARMIYRRYYYMSINLKSLFKNCYLKVNPTYRKLDSIQKELEVTRRTMRETQETLKSIKNTIIAFQTRNQSMLWLMQKENPEKLDSIKKTFWLNYPKSSGDMHTIQMGNMYVLNMLKKICDDNNLQFWLHGGTLIGGIRHSGFIPWDDDVDVAMTRQQLYKLCKLLDKNAILEMCYYYHDSNKFSRAYQVKLRTREIPCFIDVFVFDYYSAYPQNITQFKNSYKETRNAMVKKFLKLTPKLSVEDIGCHHFGSFSGTNKKVVDDIIDSHIQKFSEADNGNCLFYALENYPFPYALLPIEKLFPLKVIEFEGTNQYVPADYDLYLAGYGDYWQIPKDIGRAPHFYYYEPHLEQINNFLICNQLDINITGRNIDE